MTEHPHKSRFDTEKLDYYPS